MSFGFDEVFVLISISRIIGLDFGQMINSFIANGMMEVLKGIFSGFKKPLSDLDKKELEFLLAEFTHELRNRDRNLANKINQNRSEVITYLEIKIREGTEAIIEEIEKNTKGIEENTAISKEILQGIEKIKEEVSYLKSQMPRRFEETISYEELEESLNRPWVDNPREHVGYISSREYERPRSKEIYSPPIFPLKYLAVNSIFGLILLFILKWLGVLKGMHIGLWDVILTAVGGVIGVFIIVLLYFLGYDI